MTVVTCSTSHLLPCLARNGWETWGGTESTRTDVKVRPRATERFPRILVDRCSSRTTREIDTVFQRKDIFKDGQYFLKIILIFTIINHHFFLQFLIFAFLFKNLFSFSYFFFFILSSWNPFYVIYVRFPRISIIINYILIF